MRRNIFSMGVGFLLCGCLSAPMAYAGPPGGLFGGGSSGFGGFGGHQHNDGGSDIAAGVLNIVGSAINAASQSGHGGGHHPGHHSSHNPWPQHNHGHHHHTVPVYPSTSSPIYVESRPQPKPAPLPDVKPKKNEAPVVAVKPKPNTVFASARFLSLTSADLKRADEKLTEEQEENLDDVEDLLKDELPPSDGDLLDKMKAAGIQDVNKQLEILELTKNGEAGKAQVAWIQAGGSQEEARKLGKQIDLQNSLNELRERNLDGRLSKRDVKRFADDVRDSMGQGNNRDEVLDRLADVSDTVEIQDLIRDARPNAGNGGLGGGMVTVVQNPNLMPGQVVNLGNGTLMVGTDQGELEIGQATLAEALGMKVAQTEPTPESDAKIPTSGVVLRNDETSPGVVSYVINKKFDYEMQPGHIQSLGSGTWTVTFDRGGSFGEGNYTLKKGTYEFQPSENGWNLFAKKFEVVIDNSGNPGEFHYVVNNVAKTVAPNSSQTHTSDYPIEVRFDRGDGAGAKRKVLSDGRYEIAVSPKDNLWDLYSADAAQIVSTGDMQTISLFGN